MKRRDFLSGVGAAGLLAGVAPVLGAASRLGGFEPSPADPDEKLFAEARKHFLIPAGVAYCNTGTLGASPIEVVTALAAGNRKLERALAAWAYEKADGEHGEGQTHEEQVNQGPGTRHRRRAELIFLAQHFSRNE